ncbi:MAG: TadE family protein [Bryobacteraceae bacterium]
MPGKRKAAKGSAIIEFTLSTVPIIFVTVSLIQMSLGMWNYHTVAETVKAVTRTASVRGVGCASLACALNVGQITQLIAAKGIGLTPSSLNVTLTDTNGSISCNPVTTCYSNTTVWPRSGANSLNQLISISAKYSFSSAIAMFVPSKGSTNFGTVTLGAISQQVIDF